MTHATSTTTGEPTGDRIGVLFLNTRSALGADVAVHVCLINHLDPRRVDVFVATNRLASDHTAFLGAMRSLPAARVRSVNLGAETWSPRADRVGRRLSGAASNLGALPSLVRMAASVRAKRIDIVHTTDRPRDALFGAIVSSLGGAAHLIHAHVAWGDYFGRATRLAMRRCAGLLTISEFTRRSFAEAGLPLRRLFVAHNATDARRFDPDTIPPGRFRASIGVAADTPLIGIVGRINLWKGHLDLIEALAHVRHRFPGVRLAIVGEPDLSATAGDAPFIDQLRRRISELGQEQSVIWAGRRSDIPQVMHDLDLLCVPSWEEPFGLVVTEAMAMRTPVVGSASGALPEIVSSGHDGLLTPARDPGALAEGITSLLQDHALRSAMGIRAREQVLRCFRPEQQALAVEGVYRAIL